MAPKPKQPSSKAKKQASSFGAAPSAPASKDDIKRIQTGISGLDELIEGGLPRGGVTLLSGHCGTGKATFATQFIYHGAKEKNEPGVYITLEEEPEEVMGDVKRFGWDMEKLVKDKKISIIKPEITKFDTLKKTIEDEIDKIGAKRLVINPFGLIAAYFANVYDARKALASLRRQMQKLDCTALVVADIKEGEQTYSFTGYEEFVVTGVIVLDLAFKKESNSYVRTLFVRKMEKSNHSLKLVPLEIKPDGLVVYPDAEVF